jgi:hypothetical protein
VNAQTRDLFEYFWLVAERESLFDFGMNGAAKEHFRAESSLSIHSPKINCFALWCNRLHLRFVQANEHSRLENYTKLMLSSASAY